MTLNLLTIDDVICNIAIYPDDTSFYSNMVFSYFRSLPKL